MRQGEVYEVMCHPGYFDPEIGDPRLRLYHRWQEELDLLKSGELRNLCGSLRIKVIRYVDVQGKKVQERARILEDAAQKWGN